jgi:hypothetical protein
MHLLAERLIFWGAMIKIFWERVSRPILWHQCRSLTRQLFYISSHLISTPTTPCCNQFTRVHRESVARIGPPVRILILSIVICACSRESTLGLISCSRSSASRRMEIPSRLVIRVKILLVHERNLQQAATQTGRGAYCMCPPLQFAPSARILVLGHGHVCTGVECREREYPTKSDSHRFCWCSVTYECKDIFEIAIINFAIKFQMPRFWLPMLVHRL